MTLATPIVDEPVVYDNYAPKNFGDKYFGNTLVVDAIKKSMNSVAVKTCDYVGIDKYFEYAQEFGLTLSDNDKNYTLALGATTDGISPLELCSAYSVFPNNGLLKNSKFVRFVTYNNEQVLANDQNLFKQVLKPSTAQLMAVALLETVADGTAKSLSALPFAIAAKTGTSERGDGKNSDAWCVSFSNDYTMLVWCGSDVGMTEKGGGAPTKQSQNIWSAIDDLPTNDMRYTKQAKSFDTSDLISCDVDLYSTFAFKKTVAATENTSLEYRKTIFFDKANLPSASDSCFEKIPEPTFELTNNGRRAQISFVAEPIYEYELYRLDAFGVKLIKTYSILPKNYKQTSTIQDYNAILKTETVELYDYPFSFGNGVIYTLIAKLKGNPDIKNMSTKVLFVDNI